MLLQFRILQLTYTLINTEVIKYINNNFYILSRPNDLNISMFNTSHTHTHTRARARTHTHSRTHVHTILIFRLV